MNISAPALMLALEALNQKAKIMVAELDNAAEPYFAWHEEELHLYSKAIAELKNEYLKLLENVENLPAYEELVA